METATGIAAEHPHWYFAMGTVALAQGWDDEQFNELYARAVAVAPTYYPVHFLGATFYQPRWGGSGAALTEFVNGAVIASKNEEGMALYARIFWSQADMFGRELFAPGNADWVLMRQEFEDISSAFPQSQWNLNAFAYFACQAGDWEKRKNLSAALMVIPTLKFGNRRMLLSTVVPTRVRCSARR